MALIDKVRAACNRLAGGGWRALLLEHGLDIGAANLPKELTEKDLTDIKRSTVRGFEDFAFEGRHGIEPGDPARSLLYHAFASPNVRSKPDGSPLTRFPTLAEIEAVENYVYGVEPPSLAELRAKAGGPVAVVVFTYEYRPRPQTVHRRHADVCFARTGICRVGTMKAQYENELRGFLPFVDGEPHAFRALPARYAAFIATPVAGDKETIGPMGFQAGDGQREFWMPLHKLFNGRECLRGSTLRVTLTANHVNEKIHRIHREMRRQGRGAGWRPQVREFPFVITEGIAELSQARADGQGLLTPVPHRRLVEPARYRGKVLTFPVPADNQGDDVYGSSLRIADDDAARHAPEYVHARRMVEGGRQVDLNDQEDVEQRVEDGDYQAVHFVDFTGDGWVAARCPQLALRSLAAYSIVTAPDFFPNVDERALAEWTDTDVPRDLRGRIWSTVPQPLSEERLAANIKLRGARFDARDLTCTAIVAMRRPGTSRELRSDRVEDARHCWLPDGASGVFAPGWDTSFDRTRGVDHYASYGLGSPFPEDAKLCAALSTYWPAVAPDAARTFEPGERTVSPLTDEEIGSTGLPWDGVPGPVRRTVGGQPVVEYHGFAHADYVANALDGKFSLALTGRVDSAEYQARVLAMARVYRGLRPGAPRAGDWTVLSFRKVQATDADLLAAAQDAGSAALRVGRIYRFGLFLPGESKQHPNDVRKVRVPIHAEASVFIDEERLFLQRDGGTWKALDG